ncbi:MAG: cysteine peptidase family C39 domain-containing protein, partial [Flavisolibacter sp.]
MHLNQLLEKKTNSDASNATIQLIKQLKIPVTVSAVMEAVEQHPDHPSLLSISDSLKQWKVENLALHIEPQNLEQLPTPFIAHTKNGGGSFVLVNAVKGSVNYIDEKGKKQAKPKEEFIKDWSRVVLLAETTETSGQKNYGSERKIELLENLRIPAIILSSLLLAIFFSLTQTTAHGLWASLLILLKLTGSVVTGLLLWFEIDKSNPILQHICSSGKNTNCTAVLGSKKAKLFSWISWSEIGFFYFTGGFLSLLLTANWQLQTFSVLSWLNLFALPYT